MHVLGRTCGWVLLFGSRRVLWGSFTSDDPWSANPTDWLGLGLPWGANPTGWLGLGLPWSANPTGWLGLGLWYLNLRHLNLQHRNLQSLNLLFLNLQNLSGGPSASKSTTTVKSSQNRVMEHVYVCSDCFELPGSELAHVHFPFPPGMFVRT